MHSEFLCCILVPRHTFHGCSAGLTELPVGQYAAASWLGMLPGTSAYVLLGSAGKETLVAAGEGIPSFQLALYGALAALLPLLS